MTTKNTEGARDWCCRAVQIVMIRHLFSDEDCTTVFTDDICQRTSLIMDLFLFKWHGYSTVYTRNLSPGTILDNMYIKLALLERTLTLGTIHKSKFTMCLVILEMSQFHLLQTAFIWAFYRQGKDLSLCKIVRKQLIFQQYFIVNWTLVTCIPYRFDDAGFAEPVATWCLHCFP